MGKRKYSVKDYGCWMNIGYFFYIYEYEIEKRLYELLKFFLRIFERDGYVWSIYKFKENF